jgi:hypothetical protein
MLINFHLKLTIDRLNVFLEVGFFEYFLFENDLK